jgi:hypothetical protein
MVLLQDVGSRNLGRTGSDRWSLPHLLRPVIGITGGRHSGEGLVDALAEEERRVDYYRCAGMVGRDEAT